MKIETSYKAFKNRITELTKRQSNGSVNRSEKIRLDIKAQKYGYKRILDNIIERKTFNCLVCSTSNRIENDICKTCKQTAVSIRIDTLFSDIPRNELKHNLVCNVPNFGKIKPCNLLFVSKLRRPLHPKKANTNYPLRNFAITYENGNFNRFDFDSKSIAMDIYRQQLDVYNASFCQCFSEVKKQNRIDSHAVKRSERLQNEIEQKAKNVIRNNKECRIARNRIFEINQLFDKANRIEKRRLRAEKHNLKIMLKNNKQTC